MKRILVIQTAFIGDAILVSSLLETLHQGFPDASIDLMLRKGNESLYLGHPFIRALLVWDKKIDKYTSLFRLVSYVRGEKYDCLINVQRHWATGLLSVFSKAGHISGFKKNPLSFLFHHSAIHSIDPREGVHEIERNFKLVSHLKEMKLQPPRLYPSSVVENEVLSYKKLPYICISPASVWFTKQYPFGKWIEFIQSVKNKFVVYLLGGQSDKDYCQAIIDEIKAPGIINLAGSLSLLASAALMRDASMNYVNDSGPLHLCSAVNAPVCAVFCSTIPGFGFGPLSQNSTIIETEEPITCRPCGLHGRKNCPQGHFKCALNIKNNQLLQPLNTN